MVEPSLMPPAVSFQTCLNHPYHSYSINSWGGLFLSEGQRQIKDVLTWKTDPQRAKVSFSRAAQQRRDGAVTQTLVCEGTVQWQPRSFFVCALFLLCGSDCP